jgi:hypothetical protein
MKRVKGATITYEQITQYLALIPLAQLRENDDFVNDRHWQDGRYWIGWRPVPDERGGYSQAALRQWAYVCASFTQKNVIGSNINRLEGAILGNEPDFDIVAKSATPLDDPEKESKREKTPDEKFFDDIDKAIVNWWTQNECHQIFKNLLRAKASFGKTAIYTYIPGGFLEEKETEIILEDGTVEKKKIFGFADKKMTFEQVLSRIKIEVIHYSNVIDVKDIEFGTKFSVVALESTSDILTGTVIKKYGVFYVDTDDRSYFRVVASNGSEDKISCDLSGNNLCLTFGEYEKALVTTSVKTLQKGVNHAETGSNYALANINYPETTFINAMPIEKTDKAGNSTGVKVPPKQGLGIFRYLNGLITETATGQQITTPAIHERDGADPEKFSKESEKKSRDIDLLMGFGYKHLADSEYASGDSKAKSMDDTDILSTDYETTMNTAGTKVIENVIRLAFNFTGQTEKNREFDVLFHVNMSQGKLTNEDKTGMREECQMGLRSDESYMLVAKVSDNPIMEKQRIAAQPPKLIDAGNGIPPKPKTGTGK